MLRPTLIAITLLLGAGGCMVGPNYRRADLPTPPTYGELAPVAPAAGRSDVVADGTPTTWWKSFDDPLLASLVARAVQSNLTLAQAEARVREARAARRITAAAYWPQVDASGEYTRTHSSQNGIGSANAGRGWDLFQAGFDANWEVDVFGGIRRSVEAADADVAAAERDRDAVVVSLMGEVGLEYVTYRSLQQRTVLATANVGAQQQTVDLTKRLFDAGLAPDIDVRRATAQVATTAATIPILEQQAGQAMHRLSVLIGEPPMTLQGELAPAGEIPQPPATVSVGFPSEPSSAVPTWHAPNASSPRRRRGSASPRASSSRASSSAARRACKAFVRPTFLDWQSRLLRSGRVSPCRCSKAAASAPTSSSRTRPSRS
jgi:NodT family efflux transporter outer membrane factor (OMF) lipoprotein